MTNKRNGTLYTGVTNNIHRRVEEHKRGLADGFTRKYRLHMLVYAETCDSMEQAILREKQIKGGSSKKKLNLIEKANPQWEDITYVL